MDFAISFSVFFFHFETNKPRTQRRKVEQGQLTANQRFRHSDLVIDFVTVVLSQSEGLGKMALGIVKYAYDRSSQLIGVIWFAVSCRGLSIVVLKVDHVKSGRRKVTGTLIK